MTEATPLDAAAAAMAEGDTAARLQYYARLAEAGLFVLLAHEAEEDGIEPRVFPLESGPVVLAFDSEARLADFAGGGAFYALLSGRTLAGLMEGRGLSLGVNFGVEGAANLLPPEALSWLAGAVAEGGDGVGVERPERFRPPSVPEGLVSALAWGLAACAGLAREALLADVTYANGGEGCLLVFVGARAGAEAALTRAAREALVFSNQKEGVIDVAFRSADDPVLSALARVALHIDLRLREREEPPGAQAGQGAFPGVPRLR